uniref:AlNc14C207G8846 protein n=1 Tax=Albugo laibachii Nc14 TaxID=890382 RepID=F0WR38_9STRA|nr:AlNc14C207G8846 [Albugo laibachii Nc14]|eukprot:CCA23798.1 AlNc14C207G8846 [Albugo laibachii Nc14]
MTLRRGVMCALALSAVFSQADSRDLAPSKTQGNKLEKPADTKQYLRDESASERDQDQHRGQGNAGKGRAVGLHDDKGQNRTDNKPGGKSPDVPVIDNASGHTGVVQDEPVLSPPFSTDVPAVANDSGHASVVDEEPVKSDTDPSEPIPTLIDNGLANLPSNDAIAQDVHLDDHTSVQGDLPPKTRDSETDRSEPVKLPGKSTGISAVSSQSGDAGIDEPTTPSPADAHNPLIRDEPMKAGSDSSVRNTTTDSGALEKPVDTSTPVKSDVTSPPETDTGGEGSGAKDQSLVHDALVGNVVDSETANSQSDEQGSQSGKSSSSTDSQIKGTEAIDPAISGHNTVHNDLPVGNTESSSSGEGPTTSNPVNGKEPVAFDDDKTQKDLPVSANVDSSLSGEGPATSKPVERKEPAASDDDATQKDLSSIANLDSSLSGEGPTTSKPANGKEPTKHGDVDTLAVYDEENLNPLVLLPPKVLNPTSSDSSQAGASSSGNSNAASNILKDASAVSNWATSILDDTTSPTGSSSASSEKVSKPLISQNDQTTSTSDDHALTDEADKHSASHSDYDATISSGSTPVPLLRASESKQFASTDEATHSRAPLAVVAIAGFVGVAGIILAVFGYRHRSQKRMRRSTLSHSALGNDEEIEGQTRSGTLEREETDAEGTDIEGTFTNDISTVTV